MFQQNKDPGDDILDLLLVKLIEKMNSQSVPPTLLSKFQSPLSLSHPSERFAGMPFEGINWEGIDLEGINSKSAELTTLDSDASLHESVETSEIRAELSLFDRVMSVLSPMNVGEENIGEENIGEESSQEPTADSENENSQLLLVEEPVETSQDNEDNSFFGKVDSVWSSVNSISDNASEIGEILTGDTSLSEKVECLKGIVGEDSVAGKMLDSIESLSKHESSIVNILSVVGEHGLPIDHIEGILSYQEVS